LPNCPSCGAVLEVNLAIGTDYTHAQKILNEKASGADLTNEQLSALKWKQSQKKPQLSTIRVTPEVLEVPLLKLLHERLRSAAGNSWKLGEVSYRLSENEGTQWIQTWMSVKSENV
jgi:hypothetical protein